VLHEKSHSEELGVLVKRERHGDEQAFQMCRHSEEQTAPVGPNRYSGQYGATATARSRRREPEDGRRYRSGSWVSGVSRSGGKEDTCQGKP